MADPECAHSNLMHNNNIVQPVAPTFFSTAGKFDTPRFSLAGILGCEQNQEPWPLAPYSQQDEYPKGKKADRIASAPLNR
jgi:hypothetical protein